MSLRRMMIFALGASLINTLIKNLKDFISNFSSTKNGTTFEAEPCLTTDLTELDSYDLLESANLIVTPNNYSEARIVAVTPLPTNDIRNLLVRTEGKTASWSGTAVTIAVATGITDPFGNQNVLRVTEIASTNQHNFFQGVSNFISQLGGIYTLSVYLRKGDGAGAPDIMQLSYVNGYGNFNITTGVATSSGSVTGASMVDAGSGWWRCIISGSTTGLGAAGSNNPNVFISFVNNNSTATLRPSYAGATNRNVFVYGSQFEQSLTASAYQRNDLYTQTTNNFGLFVNSTFLPYWTNSSGLVQNTPYENLIYPSVGISSLSNGSTWRWLYIGLAATNTGLSAPDGTLTASRINLGAGTSRADYFMTYQTSGTNVFAASFPIPKIRTLIVFVKQDSTDRYLGIRLATGGNTGAYNTNSATIKIDCSDGTLANNPTDYTITYSSQSVGNGWYKVCINNASAWDSFLFQSSATLNTVNNTASAGVLIWGVQVIDGTLDITTPVYNREIGYSIPRLDYSGSSCPDYLIEAVGTNTLVQSNNFTAANWVKTNVSVSTSTFLSPTNNSYANILTATGSNGIVRQSGTSISTARHRIFSVYLQRKTGTGPVSISMGSITSIVTLTSSWQRYFVVDPLRTGTYTATSGNFTVTTSVAHGYQTGDAIFVDFVTGGVTDSSIPSITVTGSTTFTFTLGTSTTSGNCTIYSNTGKILIDTLGDEVYAWGAQVEVSLPNTNTAGFIPSSYIPTTTAQVSRGSDSTIFNINGSISSSFYVELSKIGGGNTGNPYIFLGNETSFGTSTDGIGLSGIPFTVIAYQKKENNGSLATIANPLVVSPIENRMSKLLFTITGTTLNLWMDGSLINTTTFANPSRLRYLVMDGSLGSSCRLSEIASWPTTLSAAQAQTLTYNPYFPNGTTELTFLLGRARGSGLAVPSDSTLQALDTFIATIKASGTWDKMDAIYNYAYNNTNVAAFSRLNLKNTFYTLGTSGTMTYQTNGYLTGASGYFSGYTPGINAVNVQADSNSRTYILYQSVSNAQIDLNTIHGANNAIYNGNVNTHRAMSTTNLPQSVDLSGTGLKSMVRQNASTVTLYNQSTGTTLSQARNAGNYGASQQFFPYTSGLGIGFACFGAPLTQTDIDTIRTAYNTYLSAIGLTPFA